MDEINWINLNGKCDGPHPQFENARWRYPNGRTAIRQFIKSNGVINYELVCTIKGCNFKSSPIPNSAAKRLLDKLPVLPTRYSDTTSETCCYRDCDSTETEWHHFAPYNTFDSEADNYPVMPLCRKHHAHWHKTMDGYRWRSPTIIRRDPQEVALELLQQQLGARRIVL